jgi:WD40 repeat protein
MLPELGLDKTRVITSTALRLGESKVEELARAVSESRYTAVIFTPRFLQDNWAKIAAEFAAYATVSGNDNRFIPIELEACNIPLQHGIRVRLDCREPDQWSVAMERLRNELGAPVAQETLIECPYPGMAPFTAANSKFFTGRKDLIAKMQQQLRYQNTLFVIGASGSGKSSLVAAGLLPALSDAGVFKKGFWHTETMRPGGRPFDTLVEKLGSQDFVPRIADLLAVYSCTRLLLFIDQFEEVFTLSEPKQRLAFLRGLQTLRTRCELAVVATMRAAFYQELMSCSLWPLTASERIELGPLSEEDLRSAITEPGRLCGVFVEDRLTEWLIHDAGEEPGVLPLLQETMVLLWANRIRQLIPAATYEALAAGDGKQSGRKGIAIAMALKAQVALDRLDKDKQAIARRIFLRLVQFGHGRPDTRQQLPVDELRSTTDNEVTFETTVQHLVDNGLLTVDGDVADRLARVDLAHEALIQGWPTFQSWILDRRTAEAMRRRLEGKAEEFDKRGDGGGFLDEIELSEAERYMRSADGLDLGVSSRLATLVTLSRSAIDEEKRVHAEEQRLRVAQAETIAEQERKIAVEQKERLEQQKLATEKLRISVEQQRRAAARLRVALWIVVVVFLLGASGVVVAWRTSIGGKARRLAAMATEYLDVQFDRALLMYVAAYKLDPASDLRSQLLLGLQRQPRVKKLLYTDGQPGWSVGFSTAGDLLAVGGGNGDITVWEAKTFRKLRVLHEHHAAVHALAFSRKGQMASCSADGTVKLWDISSWAYLDLPVEDKGQPVFSVAFNREGTLLAYGGGAAKIQLWDVQMQKSYVLPKVHDGSIRALVFNGKGDILVSGGTDTNLIFWDVASRQIIGEPHGDSRGGLYGLACAPSGNLMVSTSSDGKLIFWDSTVKNTVDDPIDVINGLLMTVAFSPDGTTFAAAGLDQNIRLWRLGNRTPILTLKPHHQQINAIAFSPDGNTLVSVGWDGQVVVSDLAEKNQLGRKRFALPTYVSAIGLADRGKTVIGTTSSGHIGIQSSGTTTIIDDLLKRVPKASYRGLAVSNEGKLLVAGDSTGYITFWDPNTGMPLGPPSGENGAEIADLCCKPHGSVAAIAYNNGAMVSFDLLNRKISGLPARGHTDSLNVIAFSPDGTRIATGSDDYSVVLWNALTGTPIGRRMVQGNSVRGLAFGSDRVLISGDNTGNLIFWDASTQEPLTAEPLKAHKGAIYGIAVDQTNGLAATIGEDRNIALWDIGKRTNRIKKSLLNGTPFCTAFRPGQGAVAVGFSNGQILLLDSTTLIPTGPALTGPKVTIYSMTFSSDGKTLFAAAGQKILRWDIAARNTIDPPMGGDDQWAEGVSFSADGNTLVLGSDDGTVRFYDVGTRALLGNPVAAHKGKVMCVTYSRDNKLIATADDTGEIILWDGLKHTQTGTFPKEHSGAVECLAFSLDGKLLASGGDDWSISLWDPQKLTHVDTLKGHSNVVYALAFGSDQKTLASAGRDRQIFLWNIKSRRVSTPLSGHANDIYALAFAPDGAMVASGDAEGNIILWDTISNKRIGDSFAVDGRVKSLIFSPDGKTLYAGAREVTSFDVSVDAWLRCACDIANRQPTEAELR